MQLDYSPRLNGVLPGCFYITENGILPLLLENSIH